MGFIEDTDSAFHHRFPFAIFDKLSAVFQFFS
jgi:hypothetical protein